MRLITPQRVVDLSFSNEINDLTIIKDAIIEAAQLRWIKSMTGEDLWDLLETESDAGSFFSSKSNIGR